MRKLLLVAILFIANSIASAETLNADMIKQIHEQVQKSFFDGCSKDQKGSTIVVCQCLADKTQASLDDTALSKCTNDDSGKDCVTQAVKNASIKATSKDNIMACKQKAQEQAPTNTGTTPAPVTNTNNTH